MAAAAKIDLDDLKYKGKKWEIGETKDDSEWKFQLKIPVDKREGKLESEALLPTLFVPMTGRVRQ